MMPVHLALVLLLVAAPDPDPVAGDAPLRTRWAALVDPEAPWPEHPRPTLRRDAWRSLNGPWDHAVVPADRSEPPATWQGPILVPFCIESALSGLGRRVAPDEALWYRRSFDLPERAAGERVLIHFEAVDWEAQVRVDGRVAGTHRGGYDRFTIDATDLLDDRDDHEILLRVVDPTDAGPQPRGKQVREPGGIWYTPVTGIWQSVWLEIVPATHVRRVATRCDAEAAALLATVEATAPARVAIDVLLDGAVVAQASGRAGAAIRIAIPEPRRWSPEDPALYDLRVRLEGEDGSRDAVASYAALRHVALRRDAAGHPRIVLNGRDRFLRGALDQGWWPDGLYTAPTDAALRSDLELARDLGFDLLRKHVKVEPERWYWWADRLGVLVFQDMPSGDAAIGPGDPDLLRTPESESIFLGELDAMIAGRGGHPSIIAWIPFNEGWGQFRTNEVLARVKALDPTRLVGGPSGWSDRGVGDLHDVHAYPGPSMPAIAPNRAAVLGEFGGLGLPVAGHLWRRDGAWGYRAYETPEALAEAYAALWRRTRGLAATGLAAAVYTQLTDVETEVNGLVTYDRAVVKIDAARAIAATEILRGPLPRIVTIAPTSEAEPAIWRWTTAAPEAGWEQPGFDDGDWNASAAGFGTPGTPGATVRTLWNGRELWLRRSVAFARPPRGEVMLRLHHDDDCRVWINGVLAATLTGWTTSYELVELTPEARATLHEGENLIAIQVRQGAGGQYLDAGLVELAPAPTR